MKIADLHTSAVSLVKEALEKAKKYASHNIFISLNEDEALKKAAEIDQKIQNGEKVGRLAGVPYALKDNFLSKQGNTTAASKILSFTDWFHHCRQARSWRCDYDWSH